MTQVQTRRLFLGIISYTLGTVALSSACASSPPALSSSLCTLIKDFARYQGELVLVRALVLSDAHHQSALQDPSCPRHGAELTYSDMGIRNGSAERLRKAVFSDPPGTLEKTIRVATTGRLTRKPADQGGLFVFTADLVDDIRVVAKVRESR